MPLHHLHTAIGPSSTYSVKVLSSLHIPCEHSTLDGSTDANHLIRVDTLARRPTLWFWQLGHGSHTTNKYNFVNFVDLDTSIIQSFFTRLNGALNKRLTRASN